MKPHKSATDIILLSSGESKAALASKILGWGMGFGSLFLYSPILMDLIKSSESAVDAYSVQTFIYTMLGSSATILYSFKKQFAINTYIELCNNAIQQLIIVCMICVYSNNKKFLSTLLLSVSTIGFYILRFIPSGSPVISIVQVIGTILQNFSLVPQIIKNFQQKNTRWSIYTAVAAFLGLCVRVFTTITTVKDPLLLLSYLLSASLNSVLIWQILHYGGASTSGTE